MNTRRQQAQPGPTGNNVGEYSVAELSQLIRKSVEERFSYLRVIGEISSSKQAPSGHIYFSLKEGRDTLNAIMWASTARRNPQIARIVLEEGSKACVTGKLTTYSGSSRYQLIAQDAVLTGKGAILAEIEERRIRLQSEGIFSLQEDTRIPQVPKLIGVVTSPTGSVIRDILHRVRERYPVPVIVWPAAVQGDNCPDDVIRGIRGFNNMPETDSGRPDLIIVARGGGSFEDLLGFNDEGVVRAAAESGIPLISAIGHETDRSLIDLAATMSAPTPTAAAEIALPVHAQLLARVGELDTQVRNSWVRDIASRRQRVDDLCKGMPRSDAILSVYHQFLDVISDRLPRALTASIANRQERIGYLKLMISRNLLAASADRLDRLGRQLRPGVISRRLVAMAHGLDSVETRLGGAATRDMTRRGTRLDNLGRLLDSLGYRKTLERGYAVVRENGRIIDRKEKVGDARHLEVEFHDGRVSLTGDAA